MRAVQTLLADRKRAQRGSVLSGVLIMVAFLAIISGALMTELSTQLLISRVLVNRVSTEATVNSAIELALNQLQNTALANGCPGMTNVPQFPPVTVNGRTAAVSYVSCAPVVDVRSPQFTSIAPAALYNIDGSHSIIPGTGQNVYLVGDAGGKIYSYQFGQAPYTSSNWSRDLQTSITGPSLAMQDSAGWPDNPPDTGDRVTGRNADISYLIPIAGGGSSGCSATFCVEFLGQDVPNSPDVTCFMPATAKVTSRPAAGVAFPLITFFGDRGGTLYAHIATEFSCSSGGTSVLQASNVTPGNAAIVAGPIVFKNGSQDEVYVVTSQGSTNQLLRYSYQESRSPWLTLVDRVNLPFAGPVGMAADQTTVPARVAITFAGGGVAEYNIPTSYDPALARSTVLGTGIGGAPSWCACPAGPQIGVAGTNGALYVLDTSLNVVNPDANGASFTGGSPIHTTPASDGLGEWFFGADDGYLYEVQQPPPGQTTMVQAARYGSLGGPIGSSVQVGTCPVGICAYLGVINGNAYVVPLNARQATIVACLSNLPPACSGDNPRLWAKVESGVAGITGSPQTVHVQGWSYYSP